MVNNMYDAAIDSVPGKDKSKTITGIQYQELDEIRQRVDKY